MSCLNYRSFYFPLLFGCIFACDKHGNIKENGNKEVSADITGEQELALDGSFTRCIPLNGNHENGIKSIRTEISFEKHSLLANMYYYFHSNNCKENPDQAVKSLNSYMARKVPGTEFQEINITKTQTEYTRLTAQGQNNFMLTKDMEFENAEVNKPLVKKAKAVTVYGIVRIEEDKIYLSDLVGKAGDRPSVFSHEYTMLRK